VKDANSVTLMVEGKIGNNHGSSDMVVDGKSYTVGKSPPTQPNISINLEISGDQRTRGVSGFEAGIPMVIFRFAVACLLAIFSARIFT
jgi:hypothetical protein